MCLVLAVLVCSCKSKSTDSTTHEADEVGTFTCKDVQNDKCIGATDKFEPSTPIIHVTYKSNTLPKNGDVFVTEWIAEDVGSAAPPNTTIATLPQEVKDMSDAAKSYVVNGQLSRPKTEAGWPVGKYRVDIKSGDKVVTTARFTIQ
jgi:hypothetical protein